MSVVVIPTLETERLTLRPLEVVDASRLFPIFSNATVLKHYGMEPHATVDETVHMVTNMIEGMQAGTVIRWGIVRKDDLTLIGTIGFHNLVPRHRRAEIGYEIHPDHWRNGYASEALQRALDYAAHVAAFERVGAIVYTENVASQQMLERNGFFQEGMLRQYMRQNGRAHDVYMYSYIHERQDHET
ncbi:Putative ribosomal N-acetyltransferase YdaF [Exiguobacterium aurantiacum]|uniref:Ribosomal N-acetyltransferase YdaF n=1 Tax=Exiguobacterium aurantiacum TaxID=33987 RepID=A0A377FX11_9BACL|nr:Putative ribosomal N-acetyltransferase YdaF [Exiguobacterium aurantiacum]